MLFWKCAHTCVCIHQILFIFNSLILTDIQYFSGLCENCGVIVLGWNAAMTEQAGYWDMHSCAGKALSFSLSFSIALGGKKSLSAIEHELVCVCLVKSFYFYSTLSCLWWVIHLRGFYRLFTDFYNNYFCFILFYKLYKPCINFSLFPVFSFFFFKRRIIVGDKVQNCTRAYFSICWKGPVHIMWIHDRCNQRNTWTCGFCRNGIHD